MAKIKQKVARHGMAGASTRGAQAAKQKKHKIAVHEDPKEKKLPTIVSKQRAISFINACSPSALRVLPASIVNALPREVICRGLIISDPDTSKVAFTEQPPPGYTFIAAGNPELTNALKEFASRGDHKIFVVTITPHAKRHELSRHIHRVGYHFPTMVVDQVCAHYGIRLNNKGALIDESKDDALFKRVYQNADGQRPAEEKDQVTINTEAKQAIKDLFPKIPDNDLFRIIKHAFQLSNAKVGTAPELTLLRRAHLAVVAHIRHNYTSYDKLLRTVQYNEARHQVEQETLAKIIEWRSGEDMAIEDPGRADDLLKDVIVISDEEESTGDADEVQPLHQQQVQVEELTRMNQGRGYGRSVSPAADPHREQQYQTNPRLVRTYRPSEAEIAQRNQTRYAVWEQARRDYRSRVAQNPPLRVERVYESEPVQASRILIPMDLPTPPHRTEAPIQRTMRVEYEPLPQHQPTPPKYFRDTSGNLFERVDPRPREVLAETPQRYYRQEVPAMTGALVRTRPSSPQNPPQPLSRPFVHLEGGDGSILPSVEGPEESYIPPRARRNPFDRDAELREINGVRQEAAIAREPAYIDLTNSSSLTPKRRRVEDVGPAPLSANRLVRRESPARTVEHQYVSYPPERGAHPSARIIEHGEPYYSPTLQAAPPVREHGYATRQPFYDSPDPARPVAPIYEAAPTRLEVSERIPLQIQYRSQNHGAVTRNDVDFTRPAEDLRYQPLAQADRVYEPVIESREYDSRTVREHFVPVREQYVQPATEEVRVRYIYADGTEARKPIRSVGQQPMYDYHHRPAPSQPYAL